MATAVARIAFQHAGEILQVDRQRPQQRRRSATQRATQLIDELDVSLPAAVVERVDASEGKYGGSVGRCGQRGQ